MVDFVNSLPFVEQLGLIFAAIVVPFLITFGIHWRLFKPPMQITMILLTLSPISGRTRHYTLFPINMKRDHVEFDRGDGVLETREYKGQPSIVIETKLGFDWLYISPEGSNRILSPIEIFGRKNVGDLTDSMDLSMEQITKIHRANMPRPQASLLGLLLSVGAGIGIVALLHFLGVG